MFLSYTCYRQHSLNTISLNVLVRFNNFKLPVLRKSTIYGEKQFTVRSNRQVDTKVARNKSLYSRHGVIRLFTVKIDRTGHSDCELSRLCSEIVMNNHSSYFHCNNTDPGNQLLAYRHPTLFQGLCIHPDQLSDCAIWCKKANEVQVPGFTPS